MEKRYVEDIQVDSGNREIAIEQAIEEFLKLHPNVDPMSLRILDVKEVTEN